MRHAYNATCCVCKGLTCAGWLVWLFGIGALVSAAYTIYASTTQSAVVVMGTQYLRTLRP